MSKPVQSGSALDKSIQIVHEQARTQRAALAKANAAAVTPQKVKASRSAAPATAKVKRRQAAKPAGLDTRAIYDRRAGKVAEKTPTMAVRLDAGTIYGRRAAAANPKRHLLG